MEPSGPTSGAPPALPRTTVQAPPPWQVGQLLQANVVENSAGRILLALGHRQLSAESSLPFKAGEVLTLEVRTLGARPVLKVIAALQESATAQAIRNLLPRYGASTPLLANLPRLVQTPTAGVPPALQASVAALLRVLPDRQTVSQPRGLRAAIERSGSFLEQNLLLNPAQTPRPAVIESDFKAALLRLQALLRALPATPPTSNPRPAAPLPDKAPPTPPQAPTGATADPASRSSPPPAAATAEYQAAKAAPLLSQALQRVLRQAANVGTGAPRAATGPASAIATGAGAAGAPANPNAPVPTPPPPLPGTTPTAQPAVAATLDPAAGLSRLRLDLLQQTDAALARIHLNQLASLPREGDHRLMEWLFDLPLRRGEEIDLWSARLRRDSEQDRRNDEHAAPNWSIQLAFDLPGLGPMQAQINLHGERVSTHLRTSRRETLPLLRAHLHELRDSLLAAGLQVGEVDCRPGQLDDEPTVPPGPLIDEKA